MLQSSQLVPNQICRDQELRTYQASTLYISVIMNYQTVRLVSTFDSGSFLGQAQKWRLLWLIMKIS